MRFISYTLWCVENYTLVSFAITQSSCGPVCHCLPANDYLNESVTKRCKNVTFADQVFLQYKIQ